MDLPVTIGVCVQMTSGTYLGATPGTTAAAATTTTGNGEAALLTICMAFTWRKCQAEGKDALLHTQKQQTTFWEVSAPVGLWMKSTILNGKRRLDTDHL